MNRKNFIKNLAWSAPAAVIGLNTIKTQASDKPGKQTFKAGFASCSLVPVIISPVKFRRDLEAVCSVLKSEQSVVALLSLDLIEISPETNSGLQDVISEKTGIPRDNILIHTTHSHATPWDSREENSMEGLGEELANLVLKADREALPARLKTGTADVGKSLSFQRAGWSGEELGFQSFWYGFQYRNGDTRPDASALVNEMKSRWLGHEPDYHPGNEPAWFDREVDPLVQSLVFEDISGKTIGSIVRFSAHAGPSDACRNRMYDPDYPAVVRDRMEENLGGKAMYLSGPLGNLAPKVNIDYGINPATKLPEYYTGPTWSLVARDDNQALAERDRIGNEIALAALGSLKGQPAKVVNRFGFRSVMHELPLDPDLPLSMEEIEKTKKLLIPELKAFRREGKNLRELRLLANRLNWLQWTGQFTELISTEDRKAGFTSLPLSAIVLNDNCLAFTHSETMAETSTELRKSFPDLNIVAVCLTGGSIQYIPTRELTDLGGYEGRATATTRDGEEKLRRDLGGIIASITGLKI